MLLGSVNIATSFMRPRHVGHSSTSTPKVRFKNSAHGRYVLARLGVYAGLPADSDGSGKFLASSGVSLVVVAVFFSGDGRMRERHGLAEASTPLYFTVWNRGGGTLIASRHKSERGSIKAATVPSLYARLSVIRTSPSGCRSSRSCASGGRLFNRVLGEPHVEHTIVNGAVERLDIIADDLVQDRRLRPAALVFGACPILTRAGRR